MDESPPLSRRRFTKLTAAGFTLSLLGGCENEPPPPTATRPQKKYPLADAPFIIGPLHKFKTPGVYPDFRQSHGVFIVTDPQKIIALNAACTHLGCTVNYAPPTEPSETPGTLICPCHESIFTPDGRRLGEGKAKRPLERLAITLQDGLIRIDPTQKFRDDLDEWDAPQASYIF